MPLTIPDQTIALQAKAPDMMNSLGSMLNMANSAQALKKSRATFDSDVLQRASEASSAGSRATVDQANVDPLIAQQAANTSTAQTGAQSAQFALHKDYANTALQTAGGLLKDPRITAQGASYDAEQATNALTEAMNQMEAKGVPRAQALLSVAPFVNAVHQPGAVGQMLQNTITGQLGAQGQVGAAQQSGIAVSNGQQSSVVNTNPFAGPTGQPIAGTEQQQQLPPTAPVMGGPGGTTPGYMGPVPTAPGAPAPAAPGTYASPAAATQSGMQIPPAVQAQRDGGRMEILQQELASATNPGDRAAIQREMVRTQLSMGKQAPQPAAQPAQQPRSGFVATGLPAGAAQGITGTQDQINEHWKNTQTSAGTAQQDIGVLQNIKQHAAGAATGVYADKKSFVDGLAGMLGMSSSQLAKTDADLLAKNSNMLALAGGDTNLARTMAEAATPNSHMTKEAITQAADQLIGQRKLALAKSSFLTPYKVMADQGHPEAYNSAVSAFNSVADPRVIQFKSMSPTEMASMKNSMTPQEQADFRAKLGKARDLGIAP